MLRSCKAFPLSLSLLLSLTSCTMMYLPMAQNVPAFKSKNELQLSGSYQNYQLAYSPTSHIGLIINGNYRDIEEFQFDDGKSSDYKRYSWEMEGGAGYFKNLKIGSLEVFGGFSKGFCSLTYYDSYDRTIRGGNSYFSKFFIQPNFNVGHKKLTGSLTSRFTMVDFNDFNDIGGNSITKSQPFFFEPSATIRVNFNWISIKGQMQLSIPILNSEDFAYKFGYYSPYKSSIGHSLGIILHIDRFYSRSKVTKR